MIKSVKNEQIIAKEIFSPVLSEENEKRFDRLKARLRNLLPMNYIKAIKKEITEVSTYDEEYDIDAMKYVAALKVLIDLSHQGWILEIQDNDLFLRMEADNVDDKKMLRYRLSAERNAQFKTDSVASFIRKMEATKTYNGKTVSIENLIGNTTVLMERIRNDHKVCEPYVQFVTNERDEYTGYKLTDIWRYFRYTWSIPYKTMPGRNLYYLVRDRLQAEHPVIGIFALGNSVLNLTVRDNDIGWTVEAIKTEMSRKMEVSYCTQSLSETAGKKVKVSHPKEKKTLKKERHNMRILFIHCY